MKKFLSDFFLRGLVAASFGPPVLAIIYWILGATGAVESLSPGKVALGILTIELLALVVGGMSAIYQQEQLPLATAILIHGGVLYITYIFIYLINGWLQDSLIPILVFTGIFLAGYALIWLIIYFVERAKAEKLNELLKG